MPAAVALQRLKPITGRCSQIIQSAGGLERQEFRPRPRLYPQWQPTNGMAREDGAFGLKRCWFKELDKSIKSASHALYPSRVEAWIDHFGVGVVAAIAVLAIQKIREEEAHLADIDAERREHSRRLSELREELSAKIHPGGSVGEPTGGSASQRSNQEKITLFRSLFQGRPDVFPKFWQNQKKQTNGYAPACGNEWVRGVCEKPRVRCGECPHQAFLPVTDHVIKGHLQGRHVVGVYPLLEDHTCRFLAIDFDGKFLGRRCYRLRGEFWQVGGDCRG